MSLVKCKICSEHFYAKPSHLKRGDCKYCSILCSIEGRKRGKFVKCSTCEKNVWRMPKHLDHSKSKNYFCNKSCQALWRNSVMYIGPNHPNWKGGGNSYKEILIRSSSKRVCKRCRIDDIRLLAVHHIDLDHKNNKLENLVWLCYNCHFLIHKDGSEREKFMGVMV